MVSGATCDHCILAVMVAVLHVDRATGMVWNDCRSVRADRRPACADMLPLYTARHSMSGGLAAGVPEAHLLPVCWSRGCEQRHFQVPSGSLGHLFVGGGWWLLQGRAGRDCRLWPKRLPMKTAVSSCRSSCSSSDLCLSFVRPCYYWPDLFGPETYYCVPRWHQLCTDA